MTYATLGHVRVPAPDLFRPRVEIHDGYELREQLKTAGWRFDSYEKIWYKVAPSRYDFASLADWMREALAMGLAWELEVEGTGWAQDTHGQIGWNNNNSNALRAVQEKEAVRRAVINAQRLGEREEHWDAALAAFRGLQIHAHGDPVWQGRGADVEPMVVTVEPGLLKEEQ